MKLSERQINIINRLFKSDNSLDIKDLASSQGVSLQTIYNDLKLIENINIVVKKGRVGITEDDGKRSVSYRKINDNRALREKACDFVIDEIMRGDPKGIIFIDGGSTGYLFFDCLRSRKFHDLTIITNNPMILGEMSNDQEFAYNNNIFSISGKLDPIRISLYSISVKNKLLPVESDSVLIDYFILGFRSISSNGQLYIGNEEEVIQKKTLISKSKYLILIGTPDKLDSSGLFKFSSLKEEIELNKKDVCLVFAQGDNLKIENSESLNELENSLGKSRLRLIN